MIHDSGSGEYITDGGPSDSEKIEIDSCTCVAEGRAHEKGCHLSYRNRLSGHTLLPASSSTGAQANPSTQGPEIVKPVTSEDVKPEMTVGDCLYSQNKHESCSHSLSHCERVCWPVSALLLERCSQHLVFWH